MRSEQYRILGLHLLVLTVGCDFYDASLLERVTRSDRRLGPADGGDPSYADASDVRDGQMGSSFDASTPEPGGCASTCGDVEHGTAACQVGMCVIISCEPGYADCDGDRGGCETSTRTPVNCGACGVACGDLPNAVASCESGSCEVADCHAGFNDCDDVPDNGCETPIDTLTDCGACGVPCGKNGCAGGVCTAIDCSGTPGSADCDGDELSCEINTLTDLAHCGGCDAPCALVDGVDDGHGTLVCEDGSCAIACDAGRLDCDGDYRTGCEGTDADEDGDGVPNCLESCVADPLKQAPGECGCGTPDTDSDADGVADCQDQCPQDPSTSAACLGYVPANFDPTGIDWSQLVGAALDCGTTTLDTDGPSVSNWCGPSPALSVQPQAGGPDVVVVALRGLTVASGSTLRVVGARPAILGVDGDVQISGVVDANAAGT